MRQHTTLRIGGPATAFVTVFTQTQLRAILRRTESRREVWKVVGAGSNLLFSDQGFFGTVIRLAGDFARIEGPVDLDRENSPDRVLLRAGAAVPLNELIRRTEELSLGGLESLWGIPGTVGGAIRMNAGAFGQEFSEVVSEIEVMRPDGKVLILNRSDLSFGYRYSSLAPELIILSALLRLVPAERQTLRARIAECRELRQRTQPRGASAGCIFKNPEGDSAGRLIDEAGLKGKAIGKAVIATEHANFIVNQGGARCRDVYELIELVKLKVEERFGVLLEEEIEIVGVTQGGG